MIRRERNRERGLELKVVLVIVAGALVATAVVVAGVIARGGADRPPAPVAATEHPVAVPAQARLVLVSRAMPPPSAHARRLSAMLEQGAMPRRPVSAEVETDTDCTPDAEMVSHCRNVVRLTGGTRLVLRHPHRMSDVPCLAPGETVRLVPVDA